MSTETPIATSLPGESIADFARRWAEREAPGAPREIEWTHETEASFRLVDGRKLYRVVIDRTNKAWQIIEIGVGE